MQGFYALVMPAARTDGISRGISGAVRVPAHPSCAKVSPFHGADAGSPKCPPDPAPIAVPFEHLFPNRHAPLRSMTTVLPS